MSALVLGGGRVILADRILAPGWLVVRDGRVTELGAGAAPTRTADVDCAGVWLAPGFVDMHVHGGGGASFASADAQEIARAAAFHRQHGSTTLVASLVSAPVEALERQIAALARSAVAGVHLEGPWLSPARRGAHDERALRNPTRQDVERLLTPFVRMATLAPELPGALEAIRTIATSGAAAAVGHTDATYAETRAAIDAGARVGTHVFNAMRPLHQREPGPALALLEDPRVTLEVIADSHHVHAALLRWLVATVGADRVALVTDAISAAGAGDGDYALGGLRVVVHDGLARLADNPEVLAGSTLTMADAVAFAVRELHLSVDVAARMASQTPARTLGLAGAREIRVGNPADLVLLDDDGQLQAVMCGGEWLNRQ